MAAPPPHFPQHRLYDVLASHQPPFRGKLVPNASLSESTWFHVGGPAEVLFKPADEDDLATLLAATPPDVPITVIGVASNLLVRDGGVPGIVVRLGPSFGRIRNDGTTITAGASAVDLSVARSAQAAHLSGMEFLCGIPGTVGGGLRMNAGAYGHEFKDIVLEAYALKRDGQRLTLSNADFGFSYRHTDIDENIIFLAAKMQGKREDAAVIQARMQEIQKSRSKSQPIRERTSGSTFANPSDDPQQRKCWQLIDAAGCRGLRRGEAMVSNMHCNFLINTGHATAADIEGLGEEVRRRVEDRFGIVLRWEIKRIGVENTPKV